MARALRVVLVLLCIGLIAIPYVNATSGFHTHAGKEMKFIWSEVLMGDCDERGINQDYEQDGASPCVEPLSVDSQDVIPIAIGFLVGFLQVRKILSPESKPVKSSRFAKAKVVGGGALFMLIITDMAGILAPGDEMVDWARVVGAPLPNAMFHGIFAIIGLQLIKKGRAEMAVWKEEQVTIATETEMNVQEALFSRPMQDVFGRDASTKGADKFRTVGELRTKMGIDRLDDDFERALAGDVAAAKPCGYCDGAGCGMCNNTGSL